MAIAPNPLFQYNEFTPQVQGLERQRRMAQMLLQQGMQQPQGQMVSGHYVAPSITQHLANLANVYVSKATEEEADKKQMELAQAYRQAGQQELANFLRAREGTPEQRIAQAGPPTDEMIAQGQFNPQQVIPAKAPADKMALALMASQAQYNPMLPMLGAELLKQQFKEPKWEKTTITDPRSGNEVVGYVDVNSANPESTFRPLGQGKPGISPADVMKGTYEGWYTGQPIGGSAIPAPTGASFTPNPNQKQFYGTVYNTALQKARDMGAPNPEAVATLAATQSSLETGFGNALAGGNNYFGIKGGNNPQQTKEFDPVTGQFKTITSSFRQYQDMNQSVNDYLNLLKNNYPAAFNAKSPEEAFVGITSKNPQGLRYMTDPNYLNKLQTFNASLNGQPSYQIASTSPVAIPGISGLSPKAQQEVATATAKEQAKTQTTGIQNAQKAYSVIQQAEELLPKATGGYLGTAKTESARAFGISTEASKADAKLNVLGGQLTMMVPRMEGPQSDKDTALYKAAAGDVANRTLPIGDRLAALETVKELHKKYAPELDWSFGKDKARKEIDNDLASQARAILEQRRKGQK